MSVCLPGTSRRLAAKLHVYAMVERNLALDVVHAARHEVGFVGHTTMVPDRPAEAGRYATGSGEKASAMLTVCSSVEAGASACWLRTSAANSGSGARVAVTSGSPRRSALLRYILWSA